MGGMKEKLDEATAQLGGLKAKHGKRDDELGNLQSSSCTAGLFCGRRTVAYRICVGVRLLGCSVNPDQWPLSTVCIGSWHLSLQSNPASLCSLRWSCNMPDRLCCCPSAGRQLDDVNGRLASIEKGADMKQDMIKRNQQRIGELLREVRCILTSVACAGCRTCFA